MMRHEGPRLLSNVGGTYKNKVGSSLEAGQPGRLGIWGTSNTAERIADSNQMAIKRCSSNPAHTESQTEDKESKTEGTDADADADAGPSPEALVGHRRNEPRYQKTPLFS